MTRIKRNSLISAATVAVVAMGLATAGESALANQATQIAARADSATLVAAADERALAERIERALRRADTVGAENIAVTVTNGVVKLSGTVGSPGEVRAAQEIAYAHGALVVDNKLQIPAWDITIDRPATEE